MIHRELLASGKWFKASWPARAVFAAIQAYTDRDGFLPYSARELSSLCLGGTCESWKEIEEIRNECVALGWLIHARDVEGREALFVAEFDRFQDLGRSYHTSAASVYCSPVVNVSDGVEIHLPRRVEMHSDPLVSAQDEDEVQSQVQSQSESEGIPHRDLVITNGGLPKDEKARILRAWRALHEDDEGQQAVVTPKDSAKALAAAEEGTCSSWKTPELLKGALKKSRDGLKALRDKNGKPYGYSLSAVLDNMGKDWENPEHTARKRREAKRGRSEFGDDPATGRPYNPQR